MDGDSCCTGAVNSPQTRRGVPLTVCLLAVAALAAYHNTFRDPFVLDDSETIAQNPTLRHLWPLLQAFAQPGGGATVSGRAVANFSLAINYAVSGEAGWSYHVLNLVLLFLT